MSKFLILARHRPSDKYILYKRMSGCHMATEEARRAFNIHQFHDVVVARMKSPGNLRITFRQQSLCAHPTIQLEFNVDHPHLPIIKRCLSCHNVIEDIHRCPTCSNFLEISRDGQWVCINTLCADSTARRPQYATGQ